MDVNRAILFKKGLASESVCSELKLLSQKMIDYVKRHPFFSIAVAVNLLLAYGFYATHYTFNLDQLVSEYYNRTVLVSAGRWSAPLIHLFTNWMEFAPFWHTLLMMASLGFSGLVFLVLFQEISGGKLTDGALFVFWLVFPTFPMMKEQLTYPVLNIALAYIFVPVALWLLRSFLFEGLFDKSSFICALFLLIISIDMYESFAPVFLTGVCAMIMLHYLLSEDSEKKSRKHDLFSFVVILTKASVILLIAIILDYCISKIACLLLTGTTDFWYSANTSISWFTRGGVIDSLVWLFREALSHYVLLGAGDLSVFLFDIAVIAGGVMIVVFSAKKKKGLLVLIYGTLLLSVMSLCIIEGAAPLYRMEQSIPVFFGFILMLVFQFISIKRNLKISAVIVLMIIVLSQNQAINQYSVLNYERHLYETDLMRDIGEELRKFPTADKPVALVHNADVQLLPPSFSIPRRSENPVRKYYRKVSCAFWDLLLPQKFWSSMDEIVWSYSDIPIYNCDSLIQSVKSKTIVYFPFLSFEYSDQYVPDLYRAFSRMGYDYQDCSKAQYEMAKKQLVEDDSSVRFRIVETDYIIVVQLMSVI